MGCSDLTMDERGQYITLLCMQHQKGVLTRKSVGLILGIEFDNLSPDLQKKFTVDENGDIYNERLKLEIEKRRRFCEKQSVNGKKGGRPKGSTKIKPEETKISDEKPPEEKIQKKPNPKPKRKPKETLLENGNVIENKEEILNNGKPENKKPEPEELPKTSEEIKIKEWVRPDLKIPDDLKIIWAEWLEYRKNRKIKPYATLKDGTPKYEQMAIDRLVQFSSGIPEIARIVVEHSMAMSYQGFFPLKNNQKPLNNNGEFETNR